MGFGDTQQVGQRAKREALVPIPEDEVHFHLGGYSDAFPRDEIAVAKSFFREEHKGEGNAMVVGLMPTAVKS